MTLTVSPLLKNQINNNGRGKKANHEKVYEDLKKHANDVKPNEAKAKLVKENPIQKTISAFKDNYKDGKNFFTAVKTGKMNDNSLGRINDLGMKAGALLIASFLAAHAKTKTEAIMQFIGGTTFFASMALWPKLFINLPARIVHGFPIDEKYISAQGDKKDLYLDNQFIPTGIHSEKQKRREMKRMGINPDEPNAEEKWLEIRRKTALQNRTLHMAAAGFATPLMTALVGNYVQPKVENAVIEHGFKKANEILSNDDTLNAYFAKQQDLSNAKALEKLLAGYKDRQLDDNFYKELADVLEVGDFSERMKDVDDWKSLNKLKSDDVIKALKTVKEQKSTVDITDLRRILNNIEIPTAGGFFNQAGSSKLPQETVEQIINNLGENGTLEKLRSVLKNYLSEGQENDIIASVKTNDENFFEAIRTYNKDVLSKIKGRIKAYLDLLNPIAGSKAESVYTRHYSNMMDKIAKTLGITKYKDLKEIKAKGGNKKAQEIMQKQILALIEKEDKDYIDGFNKFVEITQSRLQDRDINKLRAALKDTFGENFPLLKNEGELENFIYNIKPAANDSTKLLPENKTWLMQIFEDFSINDSSAPKRASINLFNFEGISGVQKEAADKLAQEEILGKIFKINSSNGVDQLLTDELMGGSFKNSHIYNFLSRFIKNKNTDIDYSRAKAMICANFELRAKQGLFDAFTKEEIEAMRNFLYNGTISDALNNLQMSNKDIGQNIRDAVFDSSVFKSERKAIPEIDSIIGSIKNLAHKTGDFTEITLQANSLADQLKNYATRLYNNKTWMRIFAPMAIALVAVTLIVQPFFGNIKNEFPEEKKSGGNK